MAVMYAGIPRLSLRKLALSTVTYFSVNSSFILRLFFRIPVCLCVMKIKFKSCLTLVFFFLGQGETSEDSASQATSLMSEVSEVSEISDEAAPILGRRAERERERRENTVPSTTSSVKTGDSSPGSDDDSELEWMVYRVNSCFLFPWYIFQD